MVTLRWFRAMADSYGADLQRWPEEARGKAQALLSVSPQARTLLDEARALDDAIAAASAREDAARWRPGEQTAALARLRSGVEARIASATVRRPVHRRAGSSPAGGRQWALLPQLRWLGMATGSGFAIIAGLLLGSMYAAPGTEGVLTMLQPTLIQILTD